MAYIYDKKAEKMNKILFAPKVVVQGGSVGNLVDELYVEENGYYSALDEGAVGYRNVRVLIPTKAEDVDGILSRNITYLHLPDTTFIGQWALAHSTLETIDAPELLGVNTGAFFSCASLKNVNFPKLQNIGSASSLAQGAFANCTALEELSLPSIDYIGNFAFVRATKLKKVVIGTPATIGTSSFGNCSALTTFVIDTSNGVPTLASTTTFSGTPIQNGDGYIYTDNPEALKLADVWNNFADKIKSKSELPAE